MYQVVGHSDYEGLYTEVVAFVIACVKVSGGLSKSCARNHGTVWYVDELMWVK
jgi:hypothetical protein